MVKPRGATPATDDDYKKNWTVAEILTQQAMPPT